MRPPLWKRVKPLFHIKGGALAPRRSPTSLREMLSRWPVLLNGIFYKSINDASLLKAATYSRPLIHLALAEAGVFV